MVLKSLFTAGVFVASACLSSMAFGQTAYPTMTVKPAPLPADVQSNLPQVKFCSGGKTGNYYFSAAQIAVQARGNLNVTPVETHGSLENLQKLDAGECDAAIVQSDALAVYLKENASSTLSLERGRSLYQEYVHLICNATSGITRITQLTAKNTILVGANGGGTSVTWESFKIADPKRYGVVQTLPIGGVRALGKVIDGSDAQCMLFVTGLKAGDMLDANKVASQSPGKLSLVAADDGDMPSVKDPRGKAMYTKVSIPSGTYPVGLQPSSMFGSSVGTLAVDAVIVTNSSYIDAHEKEYNMFLHAVNAAVPAITAKVTAH